MINKVLVLMSAYNGEKYIEVQINSIFNQAGVDIFLVVRDDGSKDNTLNILESLKDKYPKMRVVHGCNIGFIKSFGELIRIAHDDYPDFDYYSFVDQDDIWYENKEQVSISFLEKTDLSLPQLFCSNSRLIDGNGKPIGRKFVRRPPILKKGAFLINTLAQGCSMTFNKAAVDIYNQHIPQTVYHDRWMIMICSMFGQIHYLDEALFDYRIHANNVVGRKPAISKFEKMKASIKYWFENREVNFQNDCKLFLESFSDTSIPNNGVKILNLAYLSDKSLLAKLRIILSSEFAPSILSLKYYISFVAHLLSNKF